MIAFVPTVLLEMSAGTAELPTRDAPAAEGASFEQTLVQTLELATGTGTTGEALAVEAETNEAPETPETPETRETPEAPVYLEAIMFLPLQLKAFMPPPAEKPETAANAETATTPLPPPIELKAHAEKLAKTPEVARDQAVTKEPAKLELPPEMKAQAPQQPQPTFQPISQPAAPAAPQPIAQAAPVIPVEQLERIRELADLPKLDLRAVASVNETERVQMIEPTRAVLEVGEGDERVSVKLTAHEKTVTVEATMGNPELAVRLVDASHELRDSLRRHGMELTSFVSTSEQKNTQKDPKNRRNPQREDRDADEKKDTASMRGVFLLA